MNAHSATNPNSTRQTAMLVAAVSALYLIASFIDTLVGRSRFEDIQQISSAVPLMLVILSSLAFRNWWLAPVALVGIAVRHAAGIESVSAAMFALRDFWTGLFACLLWDFGASFRQRSSRDQNAPVGQHLRASKEVMSHLLRLQDRERSLISLEIHDGIVQHVVVAKMIAEVLAREIPDPTPDMKANLETLQSMLDDGMAEGRRLILELQPILRDDQTIAGAILKLVTEENRRGAFRIDFDCDPDLPEVSTMLENTIFRIIQECLNNARRHSQATKLELSISSSDEQIKILIRDNGVGFDSEKVKPDRFGLKSIQLRAKLFAGHAEISSELGKGTTVCVELPVHDRLDLATSETFASGH